MIRILALALAVCFSAHLGAQQTWDLQRCVKQAFEANLTIRQAQLAVDMADIATLESKGQTLPTLNGFASHGYNYGQRIDPFTNTFATERIQSNNFGLSTGMTLFNGLRTYNSIRQSETQLLQSEADLAATQNNIALTVATAYLSILFNQEFLNAAKQDVNGTQQQVDRVSTLVNAGQLPEGNLAEIEAQYYLDQASLIQAENNLDLAYLNLTQLLQLSVTEAQDFEIKQPDLSTFENISLQPNADVAVAYAVQNFPQVRSAETGVISSEYALAMAKAGRYPSLSVSYSYGTGYSGANIQGVGDPVWQEFLIGATAGGELVYGASPSYSDFETKPFFDQVNANINQSLFFSLNVPLFNGFVVRSQIQRAQIGIASAALTLDQTRQTLSQEVERAYADARAARKTVAANEKALEATEKAFGYAEVRFEEGVINAVDFNDARIRRDKARASLLRGRYDYIFKVKVLDFYMGQPITL